MLKTTQLAKNLSASINVAINAQICEDNNNDNKTIKRLFFFKFSNRLIRNFIIFCSKKGQVFSNSFIVIVKALN